MRSLSEARGSKAIGVILSGTGSDGTVGLENIKAEGGITFAQDPATAKYDGMPRSAIESGCVDLVLTPREIANELYRIERHPYVKQDEKDKEGTETERYSADDKNFATIIDQLHRASGIDFSQYRLNTIQRRSLRRMVILKLNSLGDYAKFMKEHPEEGQKLYDDVLIPVTSFFRDFDAFEALKTQVYPAILKNVGTKGTIRMWAPGCSTGEETYSLAINLLEFLGDRASSYQIQIFGTDLNEKSVEKARTGFYRASIAEEISPTRLQRFFIKGDDGYRVNKAVRDMCIFARQNLASDPPFSQMNLVACRNLVIYIQPVLQKKIIPILHYALKPSGFLFMGSSETVSGYPNLFSVVDKKHKIYSKKQAVTRLPYELVHSYLPPSSGFNPVGRTSNLKITAKPQSDREAEAEADRLVLKHHSPVGVVVNSAMEVIQFRGRTTPYLESPPGKPSLNVLKLVRNGLAIELRTLIGAAVKKGLSVQKNHVAFEDNGHKRLLNLSVTPLGDKSARIDRCFLILFENAASGFLPPPDPVSKRKAKSGFSGDLQESGRLKKELTSAREALQTAIESEDALKEEFQSVNEEILSANEELQSTNEELETSKEELQSANEELNTLNDELRNRNADLSHLNSDLANLLDAVRIPVIFVGADLRIRRLTSAASDVFRVRSSDIGRPITDIKNNLDLPDLANLIQDTVTNLTSIEREVQDTDGRWRSLEIRPYRTSDNRIEGAVLALPDIDRIKRGEQYLKKIIDNVPNPLLVLDADQRVLLANLTFCATFKVSQSQTLGQFLHHLGNEQWNILKLRELLEKVLSKNQLVKDFVVSHEFPEIGQRTMLVSGRRIEDVPRGSSPMLLLAIEDITERKFAEGALIKSEKLAAAGRLAATLAHEINNPLQAVMNLISLIGQSANSDAQDKVHARMADEELRRVAVLVKQSLAFYRESSVPSPVKPEEVLDAILELYAKRSEAKSIVTTKQYRSNGFAVTSYPGEVRQVFTTLLLNAMDAVAENGQITIRIRKSPDWRNRKSSGVRISIADNGAGIPVNNIRRIFEPFFTTKGEQGTGLGLWVAKGILDRLGGSIGMRTSVRPHKSGTIFTVFLPSTFRGASL
jgi:two-component system CheB/CheR fusion protein